VFPLVFYIDKFIQSTSVSNTTSRTCGKSLRLGSVHTSISSVVVLVVAVAVAVAVVVAVSLNEINLTVN
jgi:hypothetical protein